MNILAFDTSTETMSVALLARGQVFEQTGPGGALASTTLIPAIQSLMATASLSMAELDAIAFGRGPGSFTGLRTACAVAQGLAFGANIPVLPVNTLLIVAEEARHAAGNSGADGADGADGANGAYGVAGVVSMLDARMDEIYVALVETSAEAQLDVDTALMRPESLNIPEGWLLAGNVFEQYGHRLPSPVSSVRQAALPTASALLRLAPALLQAGLAMPAELALPLYIRDKVAKTTIERLAEKQAAAAVSIPTSTPR